MSTMFSDALKKAAVVACRLINDYQFDVRLVRGVEGKLAFAINSLQNEVGEDALLALQAARDDLGVYAEPRFLLFQDHYANPLDYFTNGWCETYFDLSSEGIEKPFMVPVKDMAVWGKDWLWLGQVGTIGRSSKRLVFHGLKGGVGRSSAIAMLAFSAAREGKKVLVLDLDLESPGVSGLLLPASRLPAFGVMDWLIEDGVYQGEQVVGDMISESPLSYDQPGSILVAPAMGGSEQEYLSKLGRAYRDLQSDGAGGFSDRLSRLVSQLEDEYKPDYVFIDSRAGLHEVAAVAITRLADLALLFAVDNDQNWNGYGQLFSHWKLRPDVSRHVRSRLLVVRALAGENARKNFSEFIERSFDLFSKNLYDEVPADDPAADVFSFDMKDTSAPHYPPIIYWDSRFQEFDPLVSEEQGGVGQRHIDLAFGDFIRRVRSALDGGLD